MASDNSLVIDILQAEKTSLDFPGTGVFDSPHSFGEGKINDALSFGFSYMEMADHMVSYVITDSKMMKKIISEIPDSTVDPEEEFIGKLWTACLIVSKRVKPEHVVFSNQNHSTVLDLNTNPNPDDMKEIDDADL